MRRLHVDASGMRVARMRNGGVHQLYDRLLFGKHVHARLIGPSMWLGRRRVRRLLGARSRVRERILQLTAVFRFTEAIMRF